VLSALLFYKLSMRIQQNARRAYYSTLLFIYNPASIHFSSFYTESLYFFLSTVVFLLSNQENDWLMIVPIAVATSLRSNSILLVPFVLFPSILSHSTPRQRRTLFFWVKTGVIMALCVSPLILYLIVNAAAFWLVLLTFA
jgi:whole genome shotgun sequence of line PN40024, scaffold_4.assembly12x (fragment)